MAWAWAAALGSALTLKPSTIALDAEASITSLSLIAPTELWMTFSLTSSVESRSSDSATASTEPCTSALRMSRSSLTSPVWICFCSPSRVMRVAALLLALSRSARMPAICRALRSSETATSTSPAAGTPDRPEDLDGIRGPGRLDLLAGGIDERADAAGVRADDDGVALVQRSVLDEHGGHRAAAAIEPALDDDALGGAGRVGLELEDLRLQRRHLEQLVDAGALLGRGRARRSSGRPTPRARGCGWTARASRGRRRPRACRSC